MLPCIDRNTPSYLSDAANKDDLVARLRKIFTDMDQRCFREVGLVMDIASATLYQFVRGGLKEPSISTLDKMVRYLAPGYEIALVPRDDAPSLCAIPTAPTISEHTIDGVVWCVPMLGTEVAGKPYRKVALATAAE